MRNLFNGLSGNAVVGRFAAQAAARKPAKLVVDERHQRVERRTIAPLPALKQLRDVTRIGQARRHATA